MTPAINQAKKKKIPYKIHKYSHTPSHTSYGLEAAECLNLDAAQVFKTLVVQLGDGTLVVGIVPVNKQLNMKQMAKAAGGKKAAMADAALVEKSTGYVLGGVSPLGQKKRLPTIIDVSARNQQTMFVSAGRRGLEIELNPNDLCRLTSASFAEIATS